jgi:hypothetical protein
LAAASLVEVGAVDLEVAFNILGMPELTINFKPESDVPELVAAAQEYRDIWSSEEERIVKVIKQVTDLELSTEPIAATIYEGPSRSHPLKLRASYDLDTKKSTLVHELMHRVLADNHIRIQAAPETLSLEIHKYLYLALYDVWCELYGKHFADKQVAVESGITQTYAEAWQWALSFSPAERAYRFRDQFSH